MINIVLPLFYLRRGLELSDIFLLNLFWAASSLLFEVPSSYLADRWGRKKTMMLGVFLMSCHWIWLFFAEGFFQLAIAHIFYGISFACISGTDQALFYDTAKELGEEKTTFGKLGKYRGATHVFKIVTPIVAVLLARDLTNLQFFLLLSIDLIATFLSFFFASRLVEPSHSLDLERLEKGVFRDGWKLLWDDKNLMKAIMNKELLFFAVFICWSFFQKFFIDLGLSIVVIGIGWGARHGVMLVFDWFVHRIKAWTEHTLEEAIHIFNILFTLTVAVFLIFLFRFSGMVMLLFIIFLVFTLFEAFRYPFFDEMFHKKFFSYNRATTLSLTNIFHNMLEFPLFLFAALLIGVDVRYSYIFIFLLGIVTVFFFRISNGEQGKALTL